MFGGSIYLGTLLYQYLDSFLMVKTSRIHERGISFTVS